MREGERMKGEGGGMVQDLCIYQGDNTIYIQWSCFFYIFVLFVLRSSDKNNTKMFLDASIPVRNLSDIHFLILFVFFLISKCCKAFEVTELY